MLIHDDTRVDLQALTAIGPEGPCSLTALEARVLHFMARRPGEIVPRERLERDVWNFRAGVRSEAVPVGMRRLRKKLGTMIETVRGKGWRLHADHRSVPSDDRPTWPLPRYATPWVGRDGWLERIDSAYAEGWRVVVLAGPHGIGTSRLAAHYAARQDDAAWVPADRLLADGDWATALAHALGLDAATALPQALDRHDLVVVDGADGARPGLEAVASLPGGPRWLFTSHRVDGHAKARVFTVPPLTLDAVAAMVGEGPLSADDVAAYSAGRPAAIELLVAAGRIPHASQDDPLQPLLSNSWGRLPPEARRVLRAACALPSPLPVGWVSASDASKGELATLQQAGLLAVDADRISVRPAVARHVRHHTDPDPADAAVQEWAVAQAEAAVEQLARHPADAVATLASWAHALDHVARDERAAPVLRVRAALALARPRAVWGHDAQVRELLEPLSHAPIGDGTLRWRLLAHLAETRWRAGAPLAQVQDPLDALPVATERHDPEWVSRALSLRATLWRGPATSEAGRDALLRLLEVVPDHHSGHAFAQARLGSSATLCPDPTEAADRCERALALVDAHGHHYVRPTIEWAVAMWAVRAGNPGRARRLLGRALRHARRFGSVPPYLWNGMGNACWAGQDDARALDAYMRAYTLADGRGSVPQAIVSGTMACWLAMLSGRTEAARDTLQHVWALGGEGHEVLVLAEAALTTRDGDELTGTLLFDSVDAASVGNALAGDGETTVRLARAWATGDRTACDDGPPPGERNLLSQALWRALTVETT